MTTGVGGVLVLTRHWWWGRRMEQGSVCAASKVNEALYLLGCLSGHASTTRMQGLVGNRKLASSAVDQSKDTLTTTQALGTQVDS
jgi:hypothetical protein